MGWSLDAFAERFAQYRYDPGSAEAIRQAFFDNLPGLIGFLLLLVIGGLALYWIAMAIAVGGLPGRRMTPDQAVGAGLRSIALGVLYVVVAIPAMFALVAVGLLAGNAAIWLLLLFIPAVMVGFAYVAVRLMFALYAIFDGVGDPRQPSGQLGDQPRRHAAHPRLAARDRRDLVRDLDRGPGSPARRSPRAPLIGTLISTLLTTAFQFFTAIVLAILYESQRMRQVYATGAALPGGPQWHGTARRDGRPARPARRPAPAPAAARPVGLRPRPARRRVSANAGWRRAAAA